MNRAIRSVAGAGVPVVDAARSSAQLPQNERIFLGAGHASGPIYSEIVPDTVPVSLAISDTFPDRWPPHAIEARR